MVLLFFDVGMPGDTGEAADVTSALRL